MITLGIRQRVINSEEHKCNRQERVRGEEGAEKVRCKVNTISAKDTNPVIDPKFHTNTSETSLQIITSFAIRLSFAKLLCTLQTFNQFLHQETKVNTDNEF